jgi:hypothetical protein
MKGKIRIGQDIHSGKLFIADTYSEMNIEQELLKMILAETRVLKDIRFKAFECEIIVTLNEIRPVNAE